MLLEAILYFGPFMAFPIWTTGTFLLIYFFKNRLRLQLLLIRSTLNILSSCQGVPNQTLKRHNWDEMHTTI
jgi:hypothetical protein